jgi:hypothetical protein
VALRVLLERQVPKVFEVQMGLQVPKVPLVLQVPPVPKVPKA